MRTSTYAHLDDKIRELHKIHPARRGLGVDWKAAFAADAALKKAVIKSDSELKALSQHASRVLKKDRIAATPLPAPRRSAAPAKLLQAPDVDYCPCCGCPIAAIRGALKVASAL